LQNSDANDDSIILANLNCEEGSFACKPIIEVSGFLTFSMMFKGETHPVFTDCSIESFVAEVEFIRTIDPTLPCTPWFQKLGPYPPFGFSFSENGVPRASV
jgi:hypothetical protein